MIKKVTSSNTIEKTTEDFKKLSIQVSLNGLSFCVLDTISNTVLQSKKLFFDKELSPYNLQKELQAFLEQFQIAKQRFSEVVVIHKNQLFSLVPKSLFKEDELAHYLKFNTKILANNHLAFDEIKSYDLFNVYVPFVNINNYIFDLFGEFEYQHHGSILINSLLNGHISTKSPICFVYISENHLDLIVISQKKLLFYNNFNYATKEDFIYYLLFTLEQLSLDPESIILKLFGRVGPKDDLYDLCCRYVKDVSMYVPKNSVGIGTNIDRESVDFTVLSTL
ncbi:MAG: DUF3822 family protein [Maribacter sp.]|nr:DUF3822 family protein [Maribacter sp.]